MITINNLKLNTSMENILKRLKDKALLKGKSIFHEFRDSNEHIQTNCPFHSNGQEKKPSFGININNGVWNCFACNEHGSLPKLVQKILDLPNYEAGKQWLIDNFDSEEFIDDENFNITLNFKDDAIIKKPTKKSIPYITEDELKKYRVYHPYMATRGLTKDIIAKYDIGFDNNFKLERKDNTGKPLLDKNGKQIYTNAIPSLTFPNKDINGNCLFIARRSVNTKFFHYPESVEKPLYGLYEMNKFYDTSKIKEILICESMLDALKFNAWNKDKSKFAFALNGLGSSMQFRDLKNLNQDLIILATDNDKRGLAARNNIRKNVKNKLYKQLIIPKGCKDLNDMNEEQINNLQIQLI